MEVEKLDIMETLARGEPVEITQQEKTELVYALKEAKGLQYVCLTRLYDKLDNIKYLEDLLKKVIPIED